MTPLGYGLAHNRRVIHLTRQPWTGSGATTSLCGNLIWHHVDARAVAVTRHCCRCVHVLIAQGRALDNGAGEA